MILKHTGHNNYNKKHKNTKFDKEVEQQEHSYTPGGRLVQPHRKIVRSYLQKLNISVTNSAISLNTQEKCNRMVNKRRALEFS